MNFVWSGIDCLSLRSFHGFCCLLHISSRSADACPCQSWKIRDSAHQFAWTVVPWSDDPPLPEKFEEYHGVTYEEQQASLIESLLFVHSVGCFLEPTHPSGCDEVHGRSWTRVIFRISRRLIDNRVLLYEDQFHLEHKLRRNDYQVRMRRERFLYCVTGPIHAEGTNRVEITDEYPAGWQRWGDLILLKFIHEVRIWLENWICVHSQVGDN